MNAAAVTRALSAAIPRRPPTIGPTLVCVVEDCVNAGAEDWGGEPVLILLPVEPPKTLRMFRVKFPSFNNCIVRVWDPELKTCEVNIVCEVGNTVPFKAVIRVAGAASTWNETNAKGKSIATGYIADIDIPVPNRYKWARIMILEVTRTFKD